MFITYYLRCNVYCTVQLIYVFTGYMTKNLIQQYYQVAYSVAYN